MHSFRVPLTPGDTYKIRVGSINACGMSQYSEAATFVLPNQGLLGPPGNVKLIKVFIRLITFLKNDFREILVFLLNGINQIKMAMTMILLSLLFLWLLILLKQKQNPVKQILQNFHIERFIMAIKLNVLYQMKL